jgi:hypothetical protein
LHPYANFVGEIKTVLSKLCRTEIEVTFLGWLQTLIMGNRDDIDQMSGGNGVVLTTALKLIDKYDLYGQVAYPKHHKQSDVPEIYRLAAKTKVFVQCLLSYVIRNMLYLLSLECILHRITQSKMVSISSFSPVLRSSRQWLQNLYNLQRLMFQIFC